jgi:hypothetical protein
MLSQRGTIKLWISTWEPLIGMYKILWHQNVEVLYVKNLKKAYKCGIWPCDLMDKVPQTLNLWIASISRDRVIYVFCLSFKCHISLYTTRFAPTTHFILDQWLRRCFFPASNRPQIILDLSSIMLNLYCLHFFFSARDETKLVLHFH